MKGPIDIKTENRHLPGPGGRAFQVGVALAVLGALALGAAASSAGMGRVYWSYLVSFAFVLSIALGALFFVLIQHVAHAGWSVVVRRFAEAMASTLPVLGLLAIPVVAGMGALYHWSHADAVAHDPILQGKAPYLNPTFFVVRLVVYFAIWSFFGWFYHSRSVRQDASGDHTLTLTLERWAPIGIILFALTTTFAAFDLLMSLDPHWFSSIFGVYYFGGAFMAFFATLTLAALLAQRSGRLVHAITSEHYHDVGKFLFAFIVFWAYIAFSQFMLIWYSNIPEETVWYERRFAGGWLTMSVVLLVGHFFGPFLALLSREPKRKPAVLAAFAIWMLAMHWVDMYWLVMPEMDHKARGVVPFHFADLGALLFVGGVFVAATAWRLSRASMVPEGDPRLAESLAFENV